MHSRISFRSDDDSDADVPSSSTFAQLRRDEFSSPSILYYPYVCSSFSQYINYNSYKFLCLPMNAVYIYIYICVTVCISRDRKNVPCFTAIDGRLVDLTRIFVSEFTTSIKWEKKRRKGRAEIYIGRKKKKKKRLMHAWKHVVVLSSIHRCH